MEHALLIERSCQDDLAKAFADEIAFLCDEGFDIVAELRIRMLHTLIEPPDGSMFGCKFLVLIMSILTRIIEPQPPLAGGDFLANSLHSFLLQCLDLLEELILHQLITIGVEAHELAIAKAPVGCHWWSRRRTWRTGRGHALQPPPRNLRRTRGDAKRRLHDRCADIHAQAIHVPLTLRRKRTPG